MTVPCLKRNSIFRQRTGSTRGEAHSAFIDALQQVLPPRGERESFVGGQLWSVPATDKLPGKLHGLSLPPPPPPSGDGTCCFHVVSAPKAVLYN